MRRIAIVLPVYNDLEACLRVIAGLTAQSGNGELIYELVVVDDGSTCPPVDPAAFSGCSLPGTVISLVRNLGQQRAAVVGLCHVAARDDIDVVVLMDADGEDRPEDVPRLVAGLGVDGANVVVAKRRRRHVGWRFKLLYLFYKFMFRLMTGRWIDFGNFSAMRIDALRRLIHMESLWTHTAASALISREPLRRIVCDRAPRHAGRSKFSFSLHITYGLRAIAVFNEVLLARIVVLSGIICVAAVAAVLFALGFKAFGLATPNWVTVIVVSMAVFTVQAVILCVLGVQIASANRTTAASPPVESAGKFVARVDRFTA